MTTPIETIVTELLKTYAAIPDTVSTEDVRAAVAEFSRTVDAAEAADNA